MSDTPKSTNYSGTEDDVSLRDIYLIIRKNLLLLILLPIIAAVVVWFISTLLPQEFEAEAVALVTPSPIRLGGNNDLTYRPSNEVSFEAYQTLAESRAVLEQTVQALPDLNLNFIDVNVKVQKLVGPQRPDQVASLLVTHQVRHSDPSAAADLADAWALATLSTVQKSLLSNMDPLITQTREEADRLLVALEESEAKLASFEARDNSASLSLLLERTNELLAEAENGLVTISELGSSALTVSTTSTSVTTEQPGGTELSLLLNLDQELTANAAIIDRLAQESLSEDLNNQLLFRETLSESLRARKELLQDQQLEYLRTQEGLLIQLAELNKERKELERDLDNAERAYKSVADLQPRFDFLSKLVPGTAQLLNEASVPGSASGPRASLNALIAFALVFFLALLFVFIREAVSVSG